jgi:glycosyltransferase involved in cell wall biosynthesis
MPSPRILFLYTELAPYVLACFQALVKRHDVEVHVVRWPVNKEAPFELKADPRVKLIDRSTLDEAGLLSLAEQLQPSVIFASGWVDKGYLKVCRAMRAAGVPTVMCSDTAWRGDARQLAAVVSARLWLRRTFSHAWVTGKAQAMYAQRLGFAQDAIRTGFYAADVDLFAPLAAQFAVLKAGRYPHRFLCVARYIPTKGHQLLCDAFAELCKAGEAGDWELWIAGTGELHEAVRRSPSGSHTRIRHLGFVQAEALPEIMAQCGVFVLPSTYEPWGVVVHEHACAGFPMVLSSAVGAAERFLKEGENGHRFIAGDKGTLKNMMRMMMLSSDAELRAMGERSAQLGRQWSPAEWAATAISFMA